jgi:Arc/MetJ family transcription regulator
MRTTIDIDDTLMVEAMKATGLGTKRAVVEAGLQQIVALHRQRQLLRLRGKTRFIADYDYKAMRIGR